MGPSNKCRANGEYHTLMSQLRKDNKRFYLLPNITFRMNSECLDNLLRNPAVAC